MSFEEFYQRFPQHRIEKLKKIENLIRSVAPEAESTLKYKMPTFETKLGWIAFTSQKHYVSVYTCSAEKIEPYLRAYPKSNCGKGCLRFSDTTEIDFKVLEEVISMALFS